MIAANFRRYPEALAHQLCLPFGALVWATRRPGARLLRAIRAARAAVVKRQPHVPAWMPPLCIEPSRPLPAWAKAQARESRGLATKVRLACLALFHERVTLVTLAGDVLVLA